MPGVVPQMLIPHQEKEGDGQQQAAAD